MKTEIQDGSSTLARLLDQVDYTEDPYYVPSAFSLELVAFMVQINDGEPLENKSPVNHLKFIDNLIGEGDVLNLCHRGFAKSTLMEYLILYLAVHGGAFPEFGKVSFAIYVSDSIDNGVKTLKNNLEYKYENSKFLQTYIKADFTLERWAFKNIEGDQFVVRAYGALTGVRGARELGDRPTLALLDDLMSDVVAGSEKSLQKLEDIISGALEYAMAPRSKTIWSGTPFNERDPITKAAQTNAYKVNLYPVCEAFPVPEEEFKGGWEDRFSYDIVSKAYDKAVSVGKVANFDRELMLRIMSDKDRLIADEDIKWYYRNDVLKHIHNFNIYITTDFGVKGGAKNDFSVISVWAHNHIGAWYWLDGTCKRQKTSESQDDLFRLVQEWKPQVVGLEVAGQLSIGIDWIESQKHSRNIYFNHKEVKVQSIGNKFKRFEEVEPMFKLGLFHFPYELVDHPAMVEGMRELKLVSRSGFRSANDDFCDTISMLPHLGAWKPAEGGNAEEREVTRGESADIYGKYASPEDDEDDFSSYLA